MYQHILVPLDGSDAASRGLAEAIEMGRNQGATLRLMHVIDEWPVAAGDMAGVNLEAGAKRLRAQGRALLEAAEARVREAGLPVASVLLEQLGLTVGASVVQEARDWPADLIVCGTHGRRGVRRLLLGSDAQYIVGHSPVPVLLVRAPAAAR